MVWLGGLAQRVGKPLGRLPSFPYYLLAPGKPPDEVLGGLLRLVQNNTSDGIGLGPKGEEVRTDPVRHEDGVGGQGAARTRKSTRCGFL